MQKNTEKQDMKQKDNESRDKRLEGQNQKQNIKDKQHFFY